METKEIGEKLVALCRDGKHLEAIDALYSDDIVSIEAASGEGMPARMEGIEAIKKKNQWWLDTFEVHTATYEGPYTAQGDDRFIVHSSLAVTHKESGQRTEMSEAAVYQVADGKIVEERFFYDVD